MFNKYFQMFTAPGLNSDDRFFSDVGKK